MTKKLKNFWTAVSFLTFILFVLAITTQQYWINIFVIILGLLIKRYGSHPLFAEGKRKRKAIMQELIDSHVILNKHEKEGN
ncbi:hypothetical protein [Lactobacillus sp. UCMA15818]|uniref:hypothetical protein n=1 Tax=Lactobacillus sp. UCMA15818 TaxID=2583394 RepID=UPI0025B22E66|nr:hypothetical protein [Lactobacillus sp. UCMA15818]MDN2454192.1 hypothetical protein [Lactobacillus sp. UCMA15818]